MKKYLSVFLFFSFTAFYSSAQDSTKVDTVKWTKTGSLQVNFSNVSLSNWAGGGQNAISIGSTIDLKAIRDTKKSHWENQFFLEYGMAKLGGSGNLFKKTSDELRLSTLYGYKIAPKWSFSSGLKFRSQMQPGWTFGRDANNKEFKQQLLSDILAPGYLEGIIGITYSEGKLFTATLAPIAGKFTFVLNDSLSNAGAFGVPIGKKVRSELGANLSMNLDWDIEKNINFKSGLNLFANYETLDLIDVNWTTLLVLKVNKYITTSFGTDLIYDHDVLIKQADGTSKRAVQFRNVLNINFGVKF